MRVNDGLKPRSAINQRWIAVCAVVLAMAASLFSQSTASPSTPRPDRITQPIDNTQVVALHGNVRADLTADRDLGAVEDSLGLRLYFVLQRSAEQQAALDNLLARQQQPGAPEYHKWLTPQEFGERFGASPTEIAKISAWLEAQGMHVNGVMNNAMFIDFSATARQVREVFHTQLHYYNVQGGKYAANAQDPMIPAALSPVVAGIKGLSKIPRQSHHTKVRRSSYDPETHRWHRLDTAGSAAGSATGAPAGKAGATPADTAGGGEYDVTPQDYYVIYNVNSVFDGGNLGAGATVAVIEQSDFEYGTVDPTTGAASGGDVATFRSKFGVLGALNMHVYHGYGSVTCNDPGIDPDGTGEEGEAALDAEWANALAPAANLIFMSCDQKPDQGIDTAMMALIDNDTILKADVLSMSYGTSELLFTTSDYLYQDTLYSQAAGQGQSFFVSAGDSGSDMNDQDMGGTATSGINVNALGSSPNITVAGGTDFADAYDSLKGGRPQSTYWGASNSATFENALGYVPETAWNDSCASSIRAAYAGYSGAGYCATAPTTPFNYLDAVIGGSGGFSKHYTAPSYQLGITGFSGSMRALPDIAGFAADGSWGHALIMCDSYQGQFPCTSLSDFGEAGGTSFVAPTMAGVAGLIVSSTVSRQGLLNTELYALAKAQFTAAATAASCYSNGQTSNTAVTSSLPVEGCIFNDVTSSNNDVPCAAGSTNCYVNSSEPFGMLSTTGTSSLAVAYNSTPGYDEVTGIGTVNVANLIANWIGSTTTTQSSTTTLTASPTTITSSQSTTLTATVTSGTTPVASGSVNFLGSGSTALGSCSLSGGSCTLKVNGSQLQTGSNSIAARFLGSGSVAGSTSPSVAVTMTGGGVSGSTSYTLTASSLAVSADQGGGARVTLNLASNGYAGNITFATLVTLDGVITNAVMAGAPAVTLASNGTASTTLMISASSSAVKHAPAAPWKGGKSGGVVVLAVLLGTPFTLRRRRLLAVLLAALTISAAGFMMSCGSSGSSSGGSPSTPQGPSARTYLVTVTAMGNPLNVTNPQPLTIAVTVP